MTETHGAQARLLFVFRLRQVPGSAGRARRSPARPRRSRRGAPRPPRGAQVTGRASLNPALRGRDRPAGAEPGRGQRGGGRRAGRSRGSRRGRARVVPEPGSWGTHDRKRPRRGARSFGAQRPGRGLRGRGRAPELRGDLQTGLRFPWCRPPAAASPSQGPRAPRLAPRRALAPRGAGGKRPGRDRPSGPGRAGGDVRGPRLAGRPGEQAFQGCASAPR